ncbi:hypothetical protein H5200_21860 [Pseudoalteromonas sp. SG43-7]|uniref:hypothetical protein n=1 Tax=unclassified Pseudoalteromonas TaxID=194690 RepID=UPI001603F388|nr:MULTISPECIES: hypothetical protein [unclassified Pseudoalteromonas]MBB1335829.1 hypothetical protein [Pseudoalteromonas sp. SR41-6]MBB1344186.1 hypothetical protein [Pseudoalteromonas sp. SR45-6]MBB1424533.1 hypothetical protein [Pseudoalteromonas sp. SG43-7]MBB1461392.1 hypothetical protein [Pseudoalteromonas sp. SG41-8]MBB1482145.1 hypothetical protein [Pseudoalteromonas sp. SG41-2]
MQILTFFLLILLALPSNSQTYAIYDRETAEAKVAPVLNALKEGVRTKNVELFSSYIFFPLNISSAQVITKDDALPIKPQKILTKEELQQRFDEIFTDTLIDLINCITPQNMIYDKYKGFDAAYGAIWFFDIVYEDSGKRLYALSSLSHEKNATNKWLDQNCKTQ